MYHRSLYYKKQKKKDVGTACHTPQARRLGGFGGFGRTARTQAKVRGAEADADFSKISSADTIYVVAYRLA